MHYHKTGIGFSNYNYENVLNEICFLPNCFNQRMKKRSSFQAGNNFLFTKYSRPLFTCLGYTAKLAVGHKPPGFNENVNENVENVLLPHDVDVTCATSVAETVLGEVTGGSTRMVITQHPAM